MGPKSGFCSDRIGELLAQVVDPTVVSRWLEHVDPALVEHPDTQPVASVQQTLDDGQRRQDGVYLTPEPLADALAAAVEATPGDTVIDLSAGAASLLAAVIRRHPGVQVVGVEKNPVLAIAAAIQLVAQRDGQQKGDRIYVGDGLSRDERWVRHEGKTAAVIGNPPYVREKGNRELFQTLRAEHPHLEQYFGPRMDLQYLFFHRGASFLRSGGRMMMLTTAYWMSATNADKVREDLAERLRPELLVRLEQAGAFADAPGQHSLISVFRRPDELGTKSKTRALSLDQEPHDWPELIDELLAGSSDRDGVRMHASDTFGATNWSPFASADITSWGRRLENEGRPLSAFLSDRQGFVSGADRFSSRHAKYYSADKLRDASASLPEKGAPIFLFERDEIPDELAQLTPTVLRPLLRASELEPNRVVVTPPGQTVALYLDGPLDVPGDDQYEALIERHLGQFRPVLERRREVKTGSMPWYRLHWPRDRAEQTGPKLVVPRRASSPCFALDLSASVVSSDCTYLVASDDVDDPLRYLVTLMVVLNSEPVERYLRHFGKAKGQQLEFYSEPLRSLPLALRRQNGRLTWIDALVNEPVRQTCDHLIKELLDGI